MKGYAFSGLINLSMSFFENDLEESDLLTYSNWQNQSLTRKISGWVTQIIGPQL